MENKDHFPEITDLLFSADKLNWNFNVCIGSSVGKSNNLFAYKEGYKRAARLLMDSVLSTKNESSKEPIDYLIYPIIFLYRHYIELSFKYLLIETCDKAPATHDLEELWKTLKPIIEKEEEIKEQDFGIEAFEIYINQFVKIDKNSSSFRYETAKNGKTNLEIKHINILQFKKNIEKFINRINFYEFYLVEQNNL